MSKKTQEMTQDDFLLAWNVIDEHEYRKRVMKVFDSVCKALLSTYGPYGASTMIEHESEMHQTKDGWLTILGIQLSNSMADKILSVIKTIAVCVVSGKSNVVYLFFLRYFRVLCRIKKDVCVEIVCGLW